MELMNKGIITGLIMIVIFGLSIVLDPYNEDDYDNESSKSIARGARVWKYAGVCFGIFLLLYGIFNN